VGWSPHFNHEKLDFVSLEQIQSSKEMLVRIVPMPTKLFERFDPDPYRVGESASG